MILDTGIATLRRRLHMRFNRREALRRCLFDGLLPNILEECVGVPEGRNIEKRYHRDQRLAFPEFLPEHNAVSRGAHPGPPCGARRVNLEHFDGKILTRLDLPARSSTSQSGQ